MLVPGVTTASLDAADEALTFSADDADYFAIQVTGTWTGTISFETSLDGTNYVALGLISAGATSPATYVTSATSNGIWSAIPSSRGLSSVRARMSAYTDGTAVVTAKVSRIAK